MGVTHDDSLGVVFYKTPQTVNCHFLTLDLG